FQAEDGIRDFHVTGVQTCALPIWGAVYYSTNAGATFTAATIPNNGNSQNGVFRLELTRNGQTMYGLAGEPAGGLWGVWKSTNGRSEERRVGKESKLEGWTCGECR